MSNPKCAVCGHVNRVGAVVCEMCDSRLGAPENFGAAAAAEFHTPGGEAREGALPTDIPSPHFKGVGDVIAPTLEVYRKHFPLVGLLVLATALPLAVMQYGAYLVTTSGLVATSGLGSTMDERVGTFGGGAVFAAAVFGGALYWLVILLGNSLLSGALVYAVVEVQRTGAARAADCLRWGLKKLPKVVALNFLYAALVYGVGFVLLFATVATLGVGFAFLLFLLLALPWIALSLMFSLIVPVAVAENCGVIESFRRSAELTRGYKGLIFLTYFLWGIAISVVSLVITFSFAFNGGGASAVGGLFLQTLVGEMLKSTTFVLTAYIFLGILNESRHGFDNRVITPATESASR
jgi:hypothetical protein